MVQLLADLGSATLRTYTEAGSETRIELSGNGPDEGICYSGDHSSMRPLLWTAAIYLKICGGDSSWRTILPAFAVEAALDVTHNRRRRIDPRDPARSTLVVILAAQTPEGQQPNLSGNLAALAARATRYISSPGA